LYSIFFLSGGNTAAAPRSNIKFKKKGKNIHYLQDFMAQALEMDLANDLILKMLANLNMLSSYLLMSIFEVPNILMRNGNAFEVCAEKTLVMLITFG
jgi:hypothetical protein